MLFLKCSESKPLATFKWVRKLRSKILRPTGFLDIKTDRNWEGVRGPNFTWILLSRLTTVGKGLSPLIASCEIRPSDPLPVSVGLIATCVILPSDLPPQKCVGLKTFNLIPRPHLQFKQLYWAYSCKMKHWTTIILSILFNAMCVKYSINFVSMAFHFKLLYKMAIIRQKCLIFFNVFLFTVIVLKDLKENYFNDNL